MSAYGIMDGATIIVEEYDIELAKAEESKRKEEYVIGSFFSRILNFKCGWRWIEN